MASLAGSRSRSDPIVVLSRLGSAAHARRFETTALERLHAFLASNASERCIPLLDVAYARAARIADAGGDNSASHTMAAQIYSADVIALLSAEGELDAADTQITLGALAETCTLPLAAASLDLFLRATSSPALLELPPLAAAEIQLRLLVYLDVAADVSLWGHTPGGDVKCLVAVGIDPGDRNARGEARRAMMVTGRRLASVHRSHFETAIVYRLGAPVAAVVARFSPDHRHDLRAYLDAAASSISPVLDRNALLERNSAAERALLTTTEARIMRIGFDLHDGPTQDLLVLGSELRQLSEAVDPLVLDSHRELVRGRFDDLLAMVGDLDRQLRETAHSLESRSIVSRPLAEVLHREMEAFSERTNIAGSITVQGDPEMLSGQQRIALFRGIQESLSNVREHSGATAVEVKLQVRRSSVEARVKDDGHGFEVNRALGLAAQRGRLGIVGIGERMRMLGGAFEVDSQPGGPTTLRMSLPRWEPFNSPSGGQG